MFFPPRRLFFSGIAYNTLYEAFAYILLQINFCFYYTHILLDTSSHYV